MFPTSSISPESPSQTDPAFLLSPSTTSPALSPFPSSPACTQATCNCDALKFTVTALSATIGITLILAIVTFCYWKPHTRKWREKGAVSRQGEIDDIKKEKEKLEQGVRYQAVPGGMNMGMGMGGGVPFGGRLGGGGGGFMGV